MNKTTASVFLATVAGVALFATTGADPWEAYSTPRKADLVMDGVHKVEGEPGVCAVDVIRIPYNYATQAALDAAAKVDARAAQKAPGDKAGTLIIRGAKGPCGPLVTFFNSLCLPEGGKTNIPDAADNPTWGALKPGACP